MTDRPEPALTEEQRTAYIATLRYKDETVPEWAADEIERLDAENAALTERLRVAEERVECLHFGPGCALCGNPAAVADARAHIANHYARSRRGVAVEDAPTSDAAPKDAL